MNKKQLKLIFAVSLTAMGSMFPVSTIKSVHAKFPARAAAHLEVAPSLAVPVGQPTGSLSPCVPALREEIKLAREAALIDSMNAERIARVPNALVKVSTAGADMLRKAANLKKAAFSVVVAGGTYLMANAPVAPVELSRFEKVKAFAKNKYNAAAGYVNMQALRNGGNSVFTGAKENKEALAILAGLGLASGYAIYKSKQVTPVAETAPVAETSPVVTKLTLVEIVKAHNNAGMIISALKANGYSKSTISKKALMNAGVDAKRAQFIMTYIK